MCLEIKNGGWLIFNHNARCKVYGGILKALLCPDDAKLHAALAANNLRAVSVVQAMGQLDAARAALWVAQPNRQPTPSQAAERIRR